MLSTAVHCVMARASPAASHCCHCSPQSSTFFMFQGTTRASSARRFSIILYSRISRPQSRPQVRLLSTHRLYPHTQQTRSPSNLKPSSPARTTTRTMASDSDYMDFLNKANSQREAGSGQQANPESSAPSQQTRTKTVDSGTTVPSALKEVDAFYISETDEPFEPVVLKWKGASQGKWPSSDEFASLVARDSSSDLSQAIETLSPSSFDPRGQYDGVVKAVQAAAASDSKKVDVKIYRVEVGHNRVEYWVVALDAEAGTIVGLKAKAIES